MEHWSRRVDSDGHTTFILAVEYRPGPNDIAYMAAYDRDYLTKLLWGYVQAIDAGTIPDSSRLRELEPGVWLLWVQARCPADIGSWYMA